MINTDIPKIKNKFYSRKWKERNKEYLKELQRFFDIVDNVENEELKFDIIYKMLKCDEILTKIAEIEMEEKV